VHSTWSCAHITPTCARLATSLARASATHAPDGTARSSTPERHGDRQHHDRQAVDERRVCQSSCATGLPDASSSGRASPGSCHDKKQALEDNPELQSCGMKSIACELPGNRQRPPAILLKLVFRGVRYHRQHWCCGEAWATARRGVLKKNAARQRTQLDERRISGAARPRVSRRPRPPLCQADFVVRIAMRRFLMVELGWRMLCKSTSVPASVSPPPNFSTGASAVPGRLRSRTRTHALRHTPSHMPR